MHTTHDVVLSNWEKFNVKRTVLFLRLYRILIQSSGSILQLSLGY